MPPTTIGALYDPRFEAVGGSPPYTWSLSTGTLPTGITLDPTGELIGTPTDSGSGGITVQVTDGLGATATQAYTLIVHYPPNLDQSMPVGDVNTPYSAQLTVYSGTPPFAFSSDAGQAGLNLAVNAGGLFTGTPTVVGSYTFNVTITDSTGVSTITSLDVEVGPVAAMTNFYLSPVLEGATVSDDVSTDGGVVSGPSPYTFGISGQPSWLALDQYGNFTGTVPAGAATGSPYSFTVSMRDAWGTTASATGSLQVSTGNPSTLNPAAGFLPPAVGDLAYSETISMSTGTGPFYWTTEPSGIVPPWLTQGTGSGPSVTLSGTPPLDAPNVHFVLIVSDGFGGQSQATYTIPVITNRSCTGNLCGTGGLIATAINDGDVNSSVTPQQLGVSGATTGLSWSWAAAGVSTAGTPPGLSLSASGQVSGTPTVAGSYPVTVTATKGNTVFTADYDITIGGAPSVVQTTLAARTVGIYLNQSMDITGGVSPVTWTIQTGILPPGLALDFVGTYSSSAFITGAPTAPGSYGFTIQAVDGIGNAVSQTYGSQTGNPWVFNVNPLTIASTTLSAGIVNQYFYASLSAYGGVADQSGQYAWSVNPTTLPPGLSLDPTGYIGGYPTTVGSYSINLSVTDSQATTTSGTVTVSISDLAATTWALAPAEQGVVYNLPLVATSSLGSVTWSLTSPCDCSPSMPPGLAMSGNTITGTPTQPGDYPLQYQVTDGTGYLDVFFDLEIGAPLTFAPAAIPANSVGGDFGVAMTAGGGALPLSWTDNGGLPPGLMLDCVSGHLTGVATTAGSYPVTITVTDAAGASVSSNLSINVQPTVSITLAALPNGTSGTAYPSTTVTVTGGNGARSFAVAGGTLPPGMSINPVTGVIGGTPTSSGAWIVYVRVHDANGSTATRVYTFTT